MFKSIGPVEFTTIYFGEGPVEKYQINGYSWHHGLGYRAAEDRRRLHRLLADPGGVHRRQRHLADHLRADHLQLRVRLSLEPHIGSRT